MALIAGSVTVNDAGVETKTPSSMAEAIYDGFINNYKADYNVDLPPPGEDAIVKRAFATLATRLSQAIVPYLVANTEVTTDVKVSTGHAGVQYVPPAVLANLSPPIAPPVACEGPPFLDAVLDNQAGTGTIA